MAKDLAGWAVLAALVLLGAGGAAARPEGALLGVPAPLVSLAGLSAVGLLWAAVGREAGRLALGLALLPALLVAALPLPGVRAFSGPPLLAFALAAAVAMLARRGRRPAAWLFLPLVFALHAGAALRVQQQVGPQGDEPHYLMVAESILRDGDVSLEADYALGRYRAFHPRDLEPHYRVRGKGGEIYSLHAVGLSLLVLPAYALAGAAGASLFMALLSALLAREIRELVRQWSGQDALAEGVGWLIALTPPLIHYAGLVFTEVPAALAGAMVLRRAGPHGPPWRALAWVLPLAALPWLHVRYAALAAVLAAYAIARRPSRASLGALALGLAASAVALGAYHHALYGFLDPRRVFGRRPELSLSLLPHGLPGLLLDQEFGLLVVAPVFALFVPGLLALWRRSRLAAAAAAGLVAAALVTAGAWPMWRGGFNPPARFLVPVLPALAAGVALALRSGPSATAAVLAGWSLWTGLAGALEPRLVHRDRDGTAPLFRALSGAEEWTRLLPGYVLEESARDRPRLALVASTALTAAALVRAPATAGWLGAAAAGATCFAAVASLASSARTEGRDAVRLVGRPAIRVPGWALERRAAGIWGPQALAWGPLYEPHRHPGGAVIGARLELPAGSYRLTVTGEAVPGGTWPSLAVQSENEPRERRQPLRDGVGLFEVLEGERAVTLRLEGGGPIVLKGLRIEPSTLP